MYDHFLGTDAYRELVRELTKTIGRLLGELHQDVRPLSVSINDGPWICGGTPACPVLTLGRHPKCDLQICAANTPYVSRLQCIVVRFVAQQRCVVYDMCSTVGTEARSCRSDGTDAETSDVCCASASTPDSRKILVFPWLPGDELHIKVSHGSTATKVRLCEPPSPIDE